jgi:UDP-N-acetylglucosamine--N-acetylmuramyl-(pentapeptide) pyrophosphoryl-undecaprenol N-acetylglucosamine transferase
MRLLICAGGTGGGVYPALAVLQRLDVEALWVGSESGVEAELVKREGIPFEAIPAAGVHGVGLRALPVNVWKLSRGLAASRRILRRFRPDVLLFTGGYVAVPMALAARLPGQHPSKSLLYVPDIEPGLALKTLARFADTIALTNDDSRAYFPRRTSVTVTGYPIRQGLRGMEVNQACKALGLSAGLPILLVMGGSSGARSINRALMAALPELLPEMQVIHLSGKLDWPEVEAARKGLSPELTARYHAYPYLHEEMGAAFSASDLVLCRAGASSLGELPLFGLPAILVPYPYAWRYQRINADYLAKRGAAIVVEDAELPAKILPIVRELMENRQRRAQMRLAMQSLARPEAATSIATLLNNLAQGSASNSSQAKEITHG